MTQDSERLEEIVRPFATVSDRIRALASAGVPRADIARFLGKRYQHVRNVLEGDAQSGGGYTLGRADLSGVHEEPRPFEREGDDGEYVQARGQGAYRLQVRPDGSLLLPKEIAAALEAGPGGVVMGKLEGDEFTLVSARTGLRRAREIVRRYVPDDVGLVDSFLADRRKAWGEEDEGDG